jgi:formamidopyrimidine-DNA glycosylase
MIELVEAKILSTQLNEVLKGKMIIKVEANKSPHKFAWYYQDPNNYPSLLEGKVVKGASYYGGTIDIDVEDINILFAEGVNLQYIKKDEDRPEKLQLLLEFNDGSCLAGTIRMYGGLWAIPKDKYSSIDPWLLKRIEESKILPNPISSAFTQEYFMEFLNNIGSNETVKAALATKNRIPGLGNGVLQDILLRAKLHPKRKLSSLSMDDKICLYNAIKETLKKMIDMGGRDSETDIYNNKGGYLTINTAFKNDGKCPVCKDKVVKEQYMGGSIYYCPSCQKLIK